MNQDQPTVTPYATRPGSRFPPGATALADGVNFCVFSRHATRVELLLYAEASSAEPFQVVALSPDPNRSFSFWHVFVEGLPVGTWYTWRVDGPEDRMETGRRFNARKELVDPRAPPPPGRSARWCRPPPSPATIRSIRAASTPPSSTSFTWAGSRGIPRAG